MKRPQTALGGAALTVLVVLGCGGRYHRGGSAGTDATTRTSCATNLKRLHDSLIAYAADYDDVFPLTTWNDALSPYLPLSSATLRCPALTTGVGYTLNSTLVGNNLNSIADADATPLFFDTEDLGANVVGTYASGVPARHGGPAVVYVSGRTVPDSTSGGDPTAVRDACRTNLKKVALAISLYASDNDDRLPSATWVDAITPYATGITDVFRCPAVAVGGYGYAYNEDLVGQSTAIFDFPSAMPSAFDSSILTRNAVSAYSLEGSRHGSGVTAYLDGHVSP